MPYEMLSSKRIENVRTDKDQKRYLCKLFILKYLQISFRGVGNYSSFSATLFCRTEIGQDLKSLINTDQVLEENERLLDNQDLAFLLKVSFRTLQRYRLKGKLPYFTIGHKTYYRASDIRAFVRERADYQTYKQFEKANQLENKL